MSRQLFTAADIYRLVNEQRSTSLVLGASDLITPEAVDAAHFLGLALVREGLVDGPPMVDRLPPLKVVRRAGVVMEPFAEGLAPTWTRVRLKDVVTSADGAPMASGYMALEKGEFPWSLAYDEIDIVLEGELVITRGSEVIRGEAGDTLFIPRGSSITFSTPGYVRFAYVTFPADWNG